MDERLHQLVAIARQHLPSVKICLYTNGDYLTLEKLRSLLNQSVDFVITQHYSLENKCSVDPLQKALKHLIEQLEPSELEMLEFNVMTPGGRLSNRGGLVPLSDYRPFKRCIMATQELEIDHAGNILLCCNQYRAEDGPVFGNLLKEPIMSIWKQSSYKTLRKNIRKGNFTLDICKRCGNGIWA